MFKKDMSRFDVNGIMEWSMDHHQKKRREFLANSITLPKYLFLYQKFIERNTGKKNHKIL